MAAHVLLLARGVLTAGDCDEPEDLSKLADAVVTKTGNQTALVQALPVDRLRTATPNHGHLIAAAMLREQALSAVVTLNFDLALPAAVGRVGGDLEVSIVAGPEDHARLGTRSIVFLHRNAYAAERDWILTSSDLAQAWRDGWVDVVAGRVLSGPVTVFAGIGTQVYSLVESAARLRQKIPGGCALFNVDPAQADHSDFYKALVLPADGYIRRGWSDFMEELSKPLAQLYADELMSTCQTRGAGSGLVLASITALCQQLLEAGLLGLGQARARWLLSRSEYAPRLGNDPAFIADLLLGIEIVQRESGKVPRIDVHDGVIDLLDGAQVIGSVVLASGRGLQGVIAVEAELGVRGDGWRRHYPRPSYVIVAGLQEEHPREVAAPRDLARADRRDDIIDANAGLRVMTIQELRHAPALAMEILK